MVKYFLRLCLQENDTELYERYRDKIQRHNHAMMFRESILMNNTETNAGNSFERNDNGIIIGWGNNNMENVNMNALHVDSGFDLFVPATQATHPHESLTWGQMYKLNHKVCCAMYKQTDDGQIIPCPFYLYPRSSISKLPFRLANSVGIIDSGYRGPLIAKFDVLQEDDNEHSTVNAYDRLCQICTPDLTPIYRVDLVESLDETERGSGGFGSTGN